MDLTNQANQPGHPRPFGMQSEPSSADGHGNGYSSMESLEMPSSSAARVALPLNAPNLEVVVNVNDDGDGDDQLEDEEEEQRSIGQPQASGPAEQEEGKLS